MKKQVTLAFSFGLNLLLAGLIARVHSPPRSTAPPPESSLMTGSGLEPPDARPEPPRADVHTNIYFVEFDWALIESPDYRLYKENLESTGCPAQRVQDILVADVEALFAAKVRDFVAPLQGRFWELATDTRNIEKLVENQLEDLKEIEKEKEQVFQELFGEADPRRQVRNESIEEKANAALDVRLDFLDETKRAAVLQLEVERETLRGKIRREKFTGSRAEIRRQRDEKLRAARESSDERLRALLTREEFEEYRLRNSPGAKVRFQLKNLSVTETETRALARLVSDQAEALAQWRSDPAAVSTQPDMKAVLEQQTEGRIRQLLGESRYLQYQRATDPRYDPTTRVLERLQFPESTAIAIHDIRLEAEKLAANLRGNPIVNEADRNAALELVRSEAESAIRQFLGGHYQDYQSNAGGWINQLSSSTGPKNH